MRVGRRTSRGGRDGQEGDRLGTAAAGTGVERAAVQLRALARALSAAPTSPRRPAGPATRSSSASSPKHTADLDAGRIVERAQAGARRPGRPTARRRPAATRGLPSTVQPRAAPLARTSSASRWVSVGCGAVGAPSSSAQHADDLAHLLEGAAAGVSISTRVAVAAPRRRRPRGAVVGEPASSPRRRCSSSSSSPERRARSVGDLEARRARRAPRAARRCAPAARRPCAPASVATRPMPQTATVSGPGAKTPARRAPTARRRAQDGDAAARARAPPSARRRSSRAPTEKTSTPHHREHDAAAHDLAEQRRVHQQGAEHAAERLQRGGAPPQHRDRHDQEDRDRQASSRRPSASVTLPYISSTPSALKTHGEGDVEPADRAPCRDSCMRIIARRPSCRKGGDLRPSIGAATRAAVIPRG